MKRFGQMFLLSIAMSCASVDPVSNCTSEVSQDLWMALDQDQLQTDVQAIDNYLAANGITAIKHRSGLRYSITQFGTGDNLPCLESPFSTVYEGRLFKDNTIFDSTTKPVAFVLKAKDAPGLILGWQIAFLELNKGTKARLYIPSGLGYGEETQYTRVGTIPANSILVFDVELLNFR